MSAELEAMQRQILRERTRFWTDVAEIGDKLQELGQQLAPAIGEVSRFQALETIERELAAIIRRRMWQ